MSIRPALFAWTLVLASGLASAAPHNAKNSLDWQGLYVGTLPCASCPGFYTEVQLLGKRSYRISETAEDKGEFSTWIKRGRFAWNAGGRSIRMGQGSGKEKDLSAIQRGDEWKRMWTMFYSYMNVNYNQLASSGKDFNIGKRKAKFLAEVIYFGVMPALAAELISGRGPDDDKDDSSDLSRTLEGAAGSQRQGGRDVACAKHQQLALGERPPCRVRRQWHAGDQCLRAGGA